MLADLIGVAAAVFTIVSSAGANPFGYLSLISGLTSVFEKMAHPYCKLAPTKDKTEIGIDNSSVVVPPEAD